MGNRMTCITLMVSMIPLVGCGTVANLTHQRPGSGGVTPFGGVRQDMACLQRSANGEVGYKTHINADSEHYSQRLLMLVCAADLPFSFVGDIITWPYTLAYTFINQPIATPPVLVANPTETPGQVVPTTISAPQTMPPAATPGQPAPKSAPVSPAPTQSPLPGATPQKTAIPAEQGATPSPSKSPGQ